MHNFDFLGKCLGKFLHHILCTIFLEKCFSYYILLADQILLHDQKFKCHYWAGNRKIISNPFGQICPGTWEKGRNGLKVFP